MRVGELLLRVTGDPDGRFADSGPVGVILMDEYRAPAYGWNRLAPTSEPCTDCREMHCTHQADLRRRRLIEVNRESDRPDLWFETTDSVVGRDLDHSHGFRRQYGR